MQVIEAPIPRHPHACAVTGRDDGQLIDFGVEQGGVDPHLYLRVGVVEEAGRLIGMVPKAEVDELREQMAAYGERVDAMQEEVEALRAFRDAAIRLDEINEPKPEPVGA